MNNFNCSVGLDIGTTSISAAIVDLDNNTVFRSYTASYDHKINKNDPDLYEVDADLIYCTAKKLLDNVFDDSSNIRSIGVTGQMHGILYIDKNGNAVSPLINWQDKRGDKICAEGVTYCKAITALTGDPIYTGYGFSTLYYDSLNGLVPAKAHSFCSIMDYIVMKLTGSTEPVVHTSVANSFGFLDLFTSSFKENEIQKLSLGIPFLPKTTDGYDICGYYKNVPVSVAIGDNQASFLGSVKNIDSDILVNIGTGSQVSSVTDFLLCNNDTEIRPLVKGKFLKCGSALCGGSAYALIENFFREYTTAAGLSTDSQYDILNKIIHDAYKSNSKPLCVKTTFKGKRSDPSVRGCILNIASEEFTPGNLALGFIFGICGELFEYFSDDIADKDRIIASGNAIQRLSVFRDVISDVFSLPVMVSSVTEEASVGAALFAGVSAGLLDSIYSFENFINYN